MRASRRISRRRLIKTAAGVVAAAASSSRIGASAAQSPAGRPRAVGNVTARLAEYMAAARARDLPADVVREAKHHILDSIAAIVSGAKLPPGEVVAKYARAQGGTPDASVLTTDIRTSAVNAALANGMFAHADETDDFEPFTKAHPGCSAVPAALAMAEKDGRSGTEFLRGVVLGYDVCCRFLMALGPDHVRATHRSAEGTSATFGAMAAASSLARLDAQQMRYAISYAAQQVSGLWSWVGDSDHVEKAFDFAGMGARNGVTAATMVQAGFTGVDDVLDGEHNMLIALSAAPRPEEMVADLGRRFYVTDTAIKLFSVGYPIQSAIDATLTLRREHGLTPDNVRSVKVRLPTDGAGIVDNSAMPDVNLQYIVAVALIDGTVSFADSHSQARMRDAKVMAVKSRVELVADRTLVVPEAPRSAVVEVTRADGSVVTHLTKYAPGTKENPLSSEAVNSKARDLMSPVLGAQRTETLIRRIQALESVENMRDLRSLLTA